MSGKPRMLFVSHRVPYPPDKGERVRALREIQALSSEYDITLAAPFRGNEERDNAAMLRRYCGQIAIEPAGGPRGMLRGGLSLVLGRRSLSEAYFASRRLLARIREAHRRRPFDLVMGYSSSTLPYVLAVEGAARVMDLVDVDSAKWHGYADNAGPLTAWAYRREARRVGDLESASLRQCRAVFLVSENETAALRAGSPPAARLAAVPNGVDLDYFRPQAVAPAADLGPAAMVFTGSMSYRPNVEGVCWFAREVLPGLQRQVPEARFVVVGRDPAPAVRRLARRGVVVTGAVPDVRPYLEAAAAGVCPLLLARGIQNKVLEAMASQRPVVASPAALEGIDAVEGEEILRAERPEEWIEALTELLQDPAAASRLAERGRRRVEADYTWQARMQTLLRICREALACGEDGSGAATGETPERTASADTA